MSLLKHLKSVVCQNYLHFIRNVLAVSRTSRDKIPLGNIRLRKIPKSSSGLVLSVNPMTVSIA